MTDFRRQYRRTPREVRVPQLYTDYYDFTGFVDAVRSVMTQECPFNSTRFNNAVCWFDSCELHERLNLNIQRTPIDIKARAMQVYMWQWTADYLVELFIWAGVVPRGCSWPRNIQGAPYEVLERIRQRTYRLLGEVGRIYFA
ncbi:hypothetical protein MCOR27_011193 [Pyricularia oryzae]|uniref:Uncharacterized protein n=1 Tax=Pyricularia grisea TaxID=148305 RepID=A0ABQ8N3M9_PYRGI|nr:hypothetical protein MCOR01_005588 [Pyricularia oryzae]KAI6290715.1 hypothetical protein MCOR33_011104 [Pyricularia grisea]KAI6261245.1 hypothetical protein MCOR19_002544 [Pyricularia oryzae]KAI6265992.1 hypothetical protein MCOR27_011193 [Pyricularia oryzae]KAI6310381.1 hypothetical protein MCOR30_011142 [Pyricularia oryzae]